MLGPWPRHRYILHASIEFIKIKKKSRLIEAVADSGFAAVERCSVFCFSVNTHVTPAAREISVKPPYSPSAPAPV